MLYKIRHLIYFCPFRGSENVTSISVFCGTLREGVLQAPLYLLLAQTLTGARRRAFTFCSGIALDSAPLGPSHLSRDILGCCNLQLSGWMQYPGDTFLMATVPWISRPASCRRSGPAHGGLQDASHTGFSRAPWITRVRGCGGKIRIPQKVETPDRQSCHTWR